MRLKASSAPRCISSPTTELAPVNGVIMPTSFLGGGRGQGQPQRRAGTVKVIGPAVQLSATPPAIDRPAPIIGQHSVEILREFGVSEAVIDDLRARNLIEQGQV